MEPRAGGLQPLRQLDYANLWRPVTRRVRRWARIVDRNRTLFLFFLGLILVDVLIDRSAAVWERYSPDDYAARVNACKSLPRSVVFIGGSPVAEGIDPARFAHSNWHGYPFADAYNLGLAGGTLSDFYHGLKRACPSGPALVVYGMTASDINDSRNEPHGPYSLMSPGDVATFVRLRPDAREWVTRHYVQGQLNRTWSLFRYRHGLRMWAAAQVEAVRPGSCPATASEAAEQSAHADALADGNGYAPLRGFFLGRFDVVKAAGKVPKSFLYLEKYRTGSHLRYLDRLLDLCRRSGAKLVIVDMPATADLEAMYPRAFVEYRSRLAEFEQRNGEHITVLRPSRAEVGLTDASFADLIHLNPAGARLLSDWLNEKIRTR